MEELEEQRPDQRRPGILPTQDDSRAILCSRTSSGSVERTGHRNDRLARGASVLVLDSDLLSIVQRGTGTEYQTLVRRLQEADDSVYVTIITFEEQMRGWMAYLARSRDLARHVIAYSKLHELIEDYSTRPILDFTEAAATEFQRLRRSRVRVGTMDLKIAAITLANNAVLLSRNVADFRRIPALRVENWV